MYCRLGPLLAERTSNPTATELLRATGRLPTRRVRRAWGGGQRASRIDVVCCSAGDRVGGTGGG